jgi:uncharacterized protein (TIGR02186 family)
MRLILALLIAGITAPVYAEEVVAGLSQNSVSLAANFEGSEILVFGAVFREAPLDENGSPLDVVITIQGPPSPVIVRRQARRFGIWMNVEAVRVRAAPSFYAVASTGPLSEIVGTEADLRNHITTRSVIYEARRTGDVEDAGSFTDALIRIRESGEFYQQLESTVEFERQTLFRATIALPKNLTEGTYSTRIFLLRDGEVIDRFQTQIEVRKAALESWIYRLAYDHPLVYGLFALFLAGVFGWGASLAFRFVRF